MYQVTTWRARALMASTALVLLAGSQAFAQQLPTGGAVAAGAAAISQAGPGSMVINQSSSRAIVNWNSFSIGQGGTVAFQNGSGATLNRVTGNVPSRIDGTLTATGSVYLVNPAGVAVGTNGRVATGGSFIASTHNITDRNFLDGGDLTFSGTSTATVVNAGKIGSLGGDVALIARKVENTGTLTARNGTVGLAAGYEVLVKDGQRDGGKFQVKVGGVDTEARTSGRIRAANAELRANGGNVYALAGNTKGVISATGTATKGGRIYLTAGSGTVEASGTITASRTARNGAKAGGDIRVSGGTVKVSGTLAAKGQGSKADGAKGGTVVVEGNAITLASTSRVDVSGATGGTALIGGDYQGGQDPAQKKLTEAVRTATTTTVEAGARLIADGTDGDGGNIVVWADGTTRFAGAISARGAGTGDGGSAEVSGKGVLAFTGTADLRADNGRTGTLLLDPWNLTISDGTDNNVSGTTASGDDSVLNVTTLQNLLSTASVTVSTGAGGSQDGNITVATAITWSSNSVLTLAAAGNIIVNAAITATGDTAGLVLQYGAGKDYSVNAPITLSGGSATLQIGEVGALQSYTLIHSMEGLATLGSATMSGHYALAQDLDAGSTSYSSSVVGTLTGTFAGLGHTISNLTITSPSDPVVGLFGVAAGRAIIRDIGLAGGSVTGSGDDASVGALVGENSGSITNAHVTGSVAGGGANASVGGLAGKNSGTITNAYSTGSVTGDGGSSVVGGLVGSNVAGSITNAYAIGPVSGSGAVFIGGLVGLNSGDITNAYATGTVNSNQDNASVGGFLGKNDGGTVTNAYATGGVGGGGAGAHVGGFVGSNQGTIATSYWDTSTTGQSNGAGDGSTAGLTGLDNSIAFTQGSYDSTWFGPGGAWFMVDGATRPFLKSEWSTTITNAHQLQLMAMDLTASYTLANDIDLWMVSSDGAQMWNTGTGFSPVGTSGSSFTGTFDGGGHAIFNLFINLAGTDNIGLFGDAEIGSVIRNINLLNANVTGDSYVGALAGYSGGLIENVSAANGNVTGITFVGGLAGCNCGTITNASASGSVNATGDSGLAFAGGLVGDNGGDITNSYATSTVTAGGDYVGGLVGSSTGSITGSYASGAVNGSGGDEIGGLVGFTSGSVTDSYATGAVVGDGHVGGLAGRNGGTITNSYATGAVTGSGDEVGGLAGRNEGTVTNSHATGAVLAAGSDVGGLIGSNNDAVDGSYATGAVSGNAHVGGLIGSNNNSNVSGSHAIGAVVGGTDVGGLIGYHLGAGGDITDSYATGAVRGSSDNVGGLIGYLGMGSVEDAYATGAVNGGAAVGGLVGYNNAGSITRSYAAGAVTGGGNDVGGLVGHSATGNISYSHATGAVTGGGNDTGGLAGYNSGTIDNSYASGGVHGVGAYVGGLVGENDGVVTYAYALGAVHGDDWYVGGLAGANGDGGSISNAYATGAVTADGGSVGGFVGGNGGSITASFWDKDTSGQADGVGEVLGGGTGSPIGLSTAQAFTQQSYTSLGSWDFSNKWFMVNGETRPFLRSEYSTTITNGHQLQLMAMDLTAAYTLGNDVDLEADLSNPSGLWTPRGFFAIGDYVTRFTGTFDGESRIINNLVMTRTTEHVGLFGYIGRGGTVQNVSLLNASIAGGDSVGILAGGNDGEIENAVASGTVRAIGSNIGGLVGLNAYQITSSYADGSVSGDSYVGGLVGVNRGTITDAYSTGVVNGINYVGGLVGRNENTLTNTYATGAVTGTTAHVGGLTGDNIGSITGSFWDPATTGQALGVGTGSATGISALDTTNAYAQDTYAAAGWDLSGIWYMVDGGTRPFLRSEHTTTLYTAHQLQLMALDLTASYTLGADIDLSIVTGTANRAQMWNIDIGFQPIGNNDTPFTGTFDGAGHAISNLYINIASDNAGLFGVSSGTIHDVALLGGSVTGYNWVGGLLGYNRGGSITNASSGANVTGNSAVGGLVGGSTFGSFDTVFTTGTVTATQGGGAGGLISESRGDTIVRAHASGAVSGFAGVGGLIGSLAADDNGHKGSLTESYATGTVTGMDNNIGGLVGGLNDSSITNSYATGAVTGNITPTGGEHYVGGLVGDAYYGSISGTYATGKVTLAGDCGGDTCAAGGLLGRNGGGGFSNSFWDISTSGMSVAIGAGDDTGGATGIDSTTAYSAATYSGAFDLGTTWFMIDGETRPFLRSEYSTTVTNTHQLQLMAMDLGASYTLAANIDLGPDLANASSMWRTDRGFVSIGSMGSEFGGTFDGGGHTISNLAINRADTMNVGLFGSTSDTAAIRAIGLVGAQVTGQQNVGSLVGYNGGSISDAFAMGGTVNADANAGGLVGWNSGTGAISIAYATGDVTADGSFAGGLVGRNDGSITNAYATGDVEATDYVGGLAGSNNGNVTNTYSTGAVTAGMGATHAGAFIGDNEATITQSFWNTDTTGSLPGVGYGSGAGATGLDTATLQDPDAFMAAASGWDFANVWAPPGDGYDPVLYALTAVVWASNVSASSTYGDSTATINSATTAGGPGAYLFGLANDAVTLQSLTVDPNTGAGTHALPTQNQDVTSSAGVTYRVLYYDDNTLTVARRAITVTADSGQSMSYGDTASGLTYTVNTGGLVNGDSLSGALATDATSTSNVGTSYSVTQGTVDNASNANYDITYVGAGFSVTRRAITVTADSGQSMGYGDTASGLTYTVNTGGLVNGDSLSGALATNATSTSNVGTGYSITQGTVDNASNGNYDISYVGAGFSVTRRAITVTADSGQSMSYGDTASGLTYTVNTGGLVNGDSLSGTLATNATSTSNVGTGYSITQGTVDNASNGNYDISYVGASFSVTRRAITVTADSGQSMGYGDTASGLTYTVNTGGLVNGDSLSGTLATNATSTSNVGTSYSVTQGTVDNASNGNYDISYVGASFAVTRRAITVTADSGQSMSYGDTASGLTYTVNTGGLVNGDSLSGALGATATSTSNVGTGYSITQGTVDNASNGNYDISYVGAGFSVTRRAITVTADSGQSMSYGDTVPGLTYTVNTGGLVNGDTLVGALATNATSTSNVGTGYSITQGSVDNASNGNYDITYAGANFAVTPRHITVTAQGGSSTYGDGATDPGLSATNLASFDTVTALTGLSNSFGITNTTNAGNYTLTVNGILTNDNYVVDTRIDGTWMVARRAITVAANDETMVEGGSAPPLTWQLSAGNLVNGDEITGALAREPGKAPGIYAILQGTLAATSNYDMTYVPGAFTITPAAIPPAPPEPQPSPVPSRQEIILLTALTPDSRFVQTTAPAPSVWTTDTVFTVPGSTGTSPQSGTNGGQSSQDDGSGCVGGSVGSGCTSMPHPSALKYGTSLSFRVHP